MYKDIINNLIPADDLHWDDEENKYVSLSPEETKEIISTCLERGMTELDDVFKVVTWCGTVRVGQILWKNFLQGSIDITGFDKNGEPYFFPTKGQDDDN